MIKKIKIYITLAAVAFSSVSCLDKYPEDAIPEGDAIRTVEEANQAVIGIYAYMKNPNLYSGLLTLLPDLQADLAYAVGFNDPKYFSTCFRKKFGISPKEFIEQLEGKGEKIV